MNNDNRCTNKKWTPEELGRELKRDRIVDREMGDTQGYRWIKALMIKIERMRFERQKNFPELTQKKLAEMAGIGHSTYKDYMSGNSDNIKLKTVVNIAHVLRCKPSDLIDEEH